MPQIKKDETSPSTMICDRLIVWFGIIPMATLEIVGLAVNSIQPSYGFEPVNLSVPSLSLCFAIFVFSFPVQVIAVTLSVLRRIPKIISRQLALRKFLMSEPSIWAVLLLFFLSLASLLDYSLSLIKINLREKVSGIFTFY